jgi:hypothetical protein
MTVAVRKFTPVDVAAMSAELESDRRMWLEVMQEPGQDREVKIYAVKELSRISTIKSNMVAIVVANSLELPSAMSFYLCLVTYARMEQDVPPQERADAWQNVTTALRTITTELNTISSARVVELQAQISQRMEQSKAEMETKIIEARAAAEVAKREAEGKIKRDQELTRQQEFVTQTKLSELKAAQQKAEIEAANAKRSAADAQERLAVARRAGIEADHAEELARLEEEVKNAAIAESKARKDACDLQARREEAQRDAVVAKEKAAKAEADRIEMERRHQQKNVFGRSWAWLVGKS